MGTWNVEGLSDIKIFQICRIMRLRSKGTLCTQETHDTNSISRYLEGGYLLINSGADDGKRSFAGVGFIVAPWLRSAVYSFKQISDRIAVLKLRVRGGKLAIINTYCPHNGYDYSVRQAHYSALRHVCDSVSCHGLKIIVGDFNARIRKCFPVEEGSLGPQCFGKQSFVQDTNNNRELLMEACAANDLAVANTFAQEMVEHQVTYHEPWQNPSGDISSAGFAQLDLLLVARNCLHKVSCIRSDRWAALPSHHFLLEWVLAAEVEREIVSRNVRFDLAALRHDCSIKQDFHNRFTLLALDEEEASNAEVSVDVVCSTFCRMAQAAVEAMVPIAGMPQATLDQKRHFAIDRSEKHNKTMWGSAFGGNPQQADQKQCEARSSSLA